MRKLKFRFLAAMLCVCVMLVYLTPSVFAASDTANPQKIRKVSKKIPGEYIVVLKDNISKPKIEQVADELVSTHGKGGKILNYYKHALKGFSVELTEKEAIALSNDPNVDYIEENGEVHTAGQYNPPWGLDRIDQLDRPLNGYFENNGYTGAGVHAYVIDTGILPTHQEFGGRASIAADFIGDGQNGNDCNGHGTHVAGTIGGTSYGVAKGVSLHAVRVLNCQGSGTYAQVIAGVDWVTGNHVSPAVANMSLVGSASDTMDSAVRNSINSGVSYVVAAGNNYGADASNYSPARVSQALTVGATDSTDNRPSFSNIGSVLDIFAPGVSVTSAWIGSNTATNTISGTSMASPHVTGVAALYLQSHPQAQTLEVNNAIVNSATVNRIVNPGQNSPNRLLKIIPMENGGSGWSPQNLPIYVEANSYHSSTGYDEQSLSISKTLNLRPGLITIDCSSWIPVYEPEQVAKCGLKIDGSEINLVNDSYNSSYSGNHLVELYVYAYDVYGDLPGATITGVSIPIN